MKRENFKTLKKSTHEFFIYLLVINEKHMIAILFYATLKIYVLKKRPQDGFRFDARISHVGT